MNEHDRVPVQQAHHRDPLSIPRHLAEIAYRGYCIEGHGDQSFERLHQRGGFSFEELVHFAYVAGLGRPVRFGDELKSAQDAPSRTDTIAGAATRTDARTKTGAPAPTGEETNAQ